MRRQDRWVLYGILALAAYLAFRGQAAGSVQVPPVTWSPEGLPIETEQGPLLPPGSTRRDVFAL